MELVKVTGIPRSTYYYWEKRQNHPDKYADVKTKILKIYHEHNGRYGYRRIAKELKKYGIHHDPKTINRLMNEIGLKCEVRLKKYRSYKGKVGTVCAKHSPKEFQSGQNELEMGD